MTDRREKRIILRSGTRAWYLFKILELLLVLFSLVLICLSRFMFTVVDNFTVAYKTDNSSSMSVHDFFEKYSDLESDGKIREATILDLLNNDSVSSLISAEDKEKIRHNLQCNVVPLEHNHTDNYIKLVDLLIMFPCCTAITIIILMEILGHLLQEKFNKWSNLIYLCLADVLSTCIFAKSIESSMNYWQFNMICNVVFSGILQVTIAINIILLCFS